MSITIQQEMMDKFGLRREMDVNGISEYDISERTRGALQKAVNNKLITILWERRN